MKAMDGDGGWLGRRGVGVGWFSTISPTINFFTQGSEVGGDFGVSTVNGDGLITEGKGVDVQREGRDMRRRQGDVVEVESKEYRMNGLEREVETELVSSWGSEGTDDGSEGESSDGGKQEESKEGEECPAFGVGHWGVNTVEGQRIPQGR